MKSLIPIALFSATSVLSAQVALIDFEDPAFDLNDSISLYSGWSIVTGTATVSDADAQAGDQSLRIAPVSGGAEVTLTVSQASPTVVFTDLWIRPMAETLSSLGSALDLDGSGVRFVEDTTDALVEVLDGDQQGGAGTWLDVQSYAIDLDGVADSWMRVTLRQDFSSDTWDLYLDGDLVAINLGLYDSVSGPALWTFYGAEDEPMFLDNLWMDDDNPLFTDTSKDGIPDAWLTEHGLNETANNRNLDADGDGLTNLEEFLLGKLPAVADYDGVTDFYYVDNAVGSDSNNGLSAVPSGANGPKETPGSAIFAAATESTIIVLPGSANYTLLTLDPDGKTLRLRPVGNVTLEAL